MLELVQALRFKSPLVDSSVVGLVQLAVVDAGGALPPSSQLPIPAAPSPDVHNPINTAAAECLRVHLSDVLEFVADVHTLSRVKVSVAKYFQYLSEDRNAIITNYQSKVLPTISVEGTITSFRIHFIDIVCL